MNDSSTRVCKNKDCKKVLPEGYKYKYCEACRNKQAQNTKKVLKGVGGLFIFAVSVVMAVGSGGKIKK